MATAAAGPSPAIPATCLVALFESVSAYDERFDIESVNIEQMKRLRLTPDVPKYKAAVWAFSEHVGNQPILAVQQQLMLESTREATQLICEAIISTGINDGIVGRLMCDVGVGPNQVLRAGQLVHDIDDLSAKAAAGRGFSYLDLCELLTLCDRVSAVLVLLAALSVRSRGVNNYNQIIQPYKTQLDAFDAAHQRSLDALLDDPAFKQLVHECEQEVDVEHESNKAEQIAQHEQFLLEVQGVKKLADETFKDMEARLSQIRSDFETMSPVERIRQETGNFLPDGFHQIQQRQDRLDKQITQQALAASTAGIQMMSTWTPDTPAPTIYNKEQCLVCFAPARTTRYYVAEMLNKAQTSDDEYQVKSCEGSVDIQSVTVKRSQLASYQILTFRLEEGMRVVAFLENKNKHNLEGWYSGTVGQKAAYNNKNRYLIFYDNGSVRYVATDKVRIHMQQPKDARGRTQPRLGWRLVPDHPVGAPNLRLILQDYLEKFPELPLVKGKPGEKLCVKRNEVFQLATVLQVDAHLVLLHYAHENVIEWLYRGSQRFKILQRNVNTQPAHSQTRRRPTLRHHVEMASANNMYASVTADRAAGGAAGAGGDVQPQVAKKRTAPTAADRLLIYDQQKRQTVDKAKKEQIVDKTTEQYDSKFEPLTPSVSACQYVAHECSDRCSAREKNMDREMREGGYSAFMLPLKQGWARRTETQTQAELGGRRRYHARLNHTSVYYVAPCGRKLRSESEIVDHLRRTNSLLTIDLFSFHPKLRPTLRVQSNKPPLAVDYSYGSERAVKVPAVNQVDNDPAPRVQYIARRYASSGHELDTAGGGGGKSLNADVGFCTGCDCVDDCADPSKCACQQLTRTSIHRLHKELRPLMKKANQTGYQNRRLMLNTDSGILGGIYECNDKCSCSRTRCVNRVAQHDIKLPLELFKTDWKGWGVRTLVDIPPGQFICTYAGAVLTNQAANACKGGDDYDAYYADLDLIEVVDDEKANLGLDDTDEAIEADAPGVTDKSSESDGDGDGEGEETDEDEGIDSAAEAQPDADDADSNYEFDDVASEPGAVPGSAALDRKSERLRAAQRLQAIESASHAPMSEDAAASIADAAEEVIAANPKDMPEAAAAAGDNDDEPMPSTSGVSDATTSASSSNQLPEQQQQQQPPQRRRRPPFSWYKFFASLPQDNDDADAGKDTFGFTLDARVKGNIGRFFNHSCEPNIFVQNVLVDTHDLRLPWIAFFAKRFVHAGEELCWNYGYQIDYTTETKIACKCGTRSCRKRLL